MILQKRFLISEFKKIPEWLNLYEKIFYINFIPNVTPTQLLIIAEFPHGMIFNEIQRNGDVA